MPYIYLDADELAALRDVFVSRSRLGHPVDWDAYDRAKARIIGEAALMSGRAEAAAARVRLTATPGSCAAGSCGSVVRSGAAPG